MALKKKAQRAQRAGRPQELDEGFEEGNDAEDKLLELVTGGRSRSGIDDGDLDDELSAEDDVEEEDNDDDEVGPDDEARPSGDKKAQRVSRKITDAHREKIAIKFDLAKQLALDGMFRSQRNHRTSEHKLIGLIPRLERKEPDPENGLDRCILLPHQKDGIGRYRHGLKAYGGALLADDMGLGKTLEFIGFIVVELNEAEGNGTRLDPFLVVVPKPLMQTWVEQFSRWVPWMKIYIPDTASLFNANEAARHDVVLLKEGLLRVMYNELADCQRDLHIIREGFEDEVIKRRTQKDQQRIDVQKQRGQAPLRRTKNSGVLKEERPDVPLFGMRFHHVVMYEIHHLRNRDTALHKAMCLVIARTRGGLTGTPLQNSVMDFGALLHYMRVAPFDDEELFKVCLVRKKFIKSSKSSV